jgi:hypothetical protein
MDNRRGGNMPRNSKTSKNGPRGNSFELLSESNDDESITVETTSARWRPLKRTQPFEPSSPLRAKRTNSTKATIPKPASAISGSYEWLQVKDLLTRVETALASAEQRADKAEKRIEALEEFIRNELFPRIGATSLANTPPPPSPPSSPPPSIAPGQIPGVGLDLSRVAIPEIKEGNAGTVHRRVNEALKGEGYKLFRSQFERERSLSASLPRRRYRRGTEG